MHSIGLRTGLSRAHGRISLDPRSSESGISHILSSGADELIPVIAGN